MTPDDSGRDGVRRILIAEDSPTQRQQLEILLEDAGYQVFTAEDGTAAIEKARSLHPDLLISDVVMPGRDGYEVCQTLKEDPATASIPIILVTGLSSAEDVFRGLNCGADNFITKPYDERYLISRINYLFTNRVLRESGKLQAGAEIELHGKRHFISADRQQILDLLISTYGEAVHLNGELREHQEILQGTLESLNAITSVTEALNRCTTRDQVLSEALGQAAAIVPSDAAWLCMRPASLDDDDIEFIDLPMLQRGASASRPPTEQCACGDPQRWSTIEAATFEPNCELAREIQDRAPSGHVLVPLRADEEVHGTLDLLWQKAEPPEPSLLRLLTAIGQQVGIALERAALHRELERKVAKRTAALTEEIRHRQMAETALEHRRREQSAIAQLGQAALESSGTEALFTQAVDLVHATLRVDTTTLILKTLDDGFRVAAGAGLMAGREGSYVTRAYQGSFPQFVLGVVEPVLVPDWRVEDRFDPTPRMREDGIVSSLAIAVRGADRMIGMLSVHTVAPRTFDPEEIAFVRAIATTLSASRAREETLKRLRESEEEFRATFEQAAVGIVHAELDGSLLRANRLLSEMLGYSDSELLGMLPSQVTHPDEIAAEARGMGRLKDGEIEVFRRQKRFIRKDGSTFWAHVTTSLKFDTSGSAQYMISVVQDITDQKRSEEQIGHLQKLEAVGRLTGGISHDFNNLLMIIIGNLELLAENVESDPENAELVGAALSAATRGSELTRKLLTMSRRQPLDPKVLNLNELVESLAKLLSRTIGSSIQIKIEPVKGLWPCRADPGQLESAIANLALNARDAMPNGGTLTFVTTNVRHEAEVDSVRPGLASGDYVCLSVSDTGTGIPANVLPMIFEPYFTTKESGKGTGLGLSTAYGFVRQSGGEITVYSEEGLGTTFHIYLPRDNGSGDSGANEEELSETAANFTGRTALLVDDDAEIRRVMHRHLQDLGFEVVEEADGESALAALEQRSFDVVVTDYSLGGGISGAELVTRCEENWPGMAEVMCSGLPEVAGLGDGARRSNFAFLLKPVTRQSLGTALQRVLDGVRYGDKPSADP
ncbi:response regulator [Amorphus sp. 3PC139-8]|uniref:response regulator n=1 Tax=Amorphus sp. 3PC139-8 TaxID=2735676 RepID=UPI00345DFFFF